MGTPTQWYQPDQQDQPPDAAPASQQPPAPDLYGIGTVLNTPPQAVQDAQNQNTIQNIVGGGANQPQPELAPQPRQSGIKRVLSEIGKGALMTFFPAATPEFRQQIALHQGVMQGQSRELNAVAAEHEEMLRPRPLTAPDGSYLRGPDGMPRMGTQHDQDAAGTFYNVSGGGLYQIRPEDVQGTQYEHMAGETLFKRDAVALESTANKPAVADRLWNEAVKDLDAAIKRNDPHVEIYRQRVSSLSAAFAQKNHPQIAKTAIQIANEDSIRTKGRPMNQQEVLEFNRSNAQNTHIVNPKDTSARTDRSYQFNASQVEKVGGALDEGVKRMGRLIDTVNQATPQADALIAPELLTVMAGGQGSGLRMNEAEIARIVGGQSNWENIKKAANKWQIDPTKALSVNPEQRRQIRALLTVVNDRLTQKSDIVNEARQALVNTDDVNQHRQIVADMHKKLATVDSGGGDNGAPPPGAKVRDYTNLGRQ